MVHRPRIAARATSTGQLASGLRVRPAASGTNSSSHASSLTRLVSVVGVRFPVDMDDVAKLHYDSMRLSTDPAQHPAAFAAAFNSGDPSRVEQVYEDLGVLVAEPGRPVTGRDRAAANATFQALGPPITVRPRHVYVADDIALLIVDWTLKGSGPYVSPVHIEGTATDVARRGSDGRWRYIIDNPFVTARRDP